MMAQATSLMDRLPTAIGSELVKRRKDAAALKWAQEQFESCQRARLQFERVWFSNLAFYFGKQYLQWTSELGALGRLIQPSAPPWRVRAISNKIKPIVRTEHAKLNKEHPQPFVIPSTTDTTDLQAARAAEHITEHLWREYKLNSLIRKATFWQIITGNGFIKDWWDPNSKDKDGNMGRIRWESLTPFHLYVPSLLEEEIDAQPYYIHSVSKSPFWVKKTYGKSIPVNTSTNAVDNVMARIYQALGMNADNAEVLHVKQMTVRESELFPEGGKITWCEDQLLDVEETWPEIWERDEFNIAHLKHVPTGRFYADSVVPDLIPLQKEYNRTRSQIIEAKNLTAKPQILAPRGSVDVSKWTSEPGLVIQYTPGLEPPQPLPLQGLPTYVMDSLETVQRDMDDISSQHEVTKGRTPPGVSAATAIAYLQEEDDSKLAASVASLEEAVERIGTHSLHYVRKFWTTARAVRITGREQLHEVYQLKGSSIRDNVRISIEAGSAQPRSKAAKQAFLMELGERGWIPPDKVLQYLDMAEAGSMYQELQIDIRSAQRENVIMAQDWAELLMSAIDPDTEIPMGTLPVSDWDNHQVHIEYHNQFRKLQQYEELPEKAQEVFQLHVDLHRQLSMAQLGMNPEPGAITPAEIDPSIPEVPFGSGLGGGEPSPEEVSQVPDDMGATTDMPPSGGPQPAGGDMPPESESVE